MSPVHRSIVKVEISDDERQVRPIIECHECGRISLPWISAEHLTTLARTFANTARALGITGGRQHQLTDVVATEAEVDAILDRGRQNQDQN